MSVRATDPSPADRLNIATQQTYQLERIDVPSYQQNKDQAAMRARLRLVGSLVTDLPPTLKSYQLARDLLNASRQVIPNHQIPNCLPHIWGKLIGEKRTIKLLNYGIEAEKQKTEPPTPSREQTDFTFTDRDQGVASRGVYGLRISLRSIQPVPIPDSKENTGKPASPRAIPNDRLLVADDSTDPFMLPA
jgi:hypothetical protein